MMAASKKDQLAAAEKEIARAKEEIEEEKRKLKVAEKEAVKLRKDLAEEDKKTGGKKGKKLQKLRDHQDLKILSKDVKGRQLVVTFEAINGNLKWPATLYGNVYICAGIRKGKLKCKQPRHTLPETHSDADLKSIIHKHADCTLGTKTGIRPDYPIVRS